MTHKHTLRRSLLALAAGAALALPWSNAAAQDMAASFPSKPIKMLVPFSAGGGIDLIARITAQKMGENLGQQVVVDNQGGGGGVVASRNVAKAPADGYTLIFHSVSSAVVNAQVFNNLGYDPIGGFTPVSLVAQFPLVLIVNPNVPAKDMKEFIALLKANPGKYSYGSSGVGSGIHLAGERFKTLAGVDIQHIPYKGTAAALTDVLGGRVEMLIDGVPPQVGNIAQGRVRPLAVTTTTRSFVLPNVPTIAESGVPGFSFGNYWGLLMPTGSPAAAVTRINSEIKKLLEQTEVRQQLENAGFAPLASTPLEYGQALQKSYDQIGQLVKKAKITFD